jgi:GPI mannosyltransferase 2
MLDIRRDHQTTQHLRLLDRLTLLSRVLAAAFLYLSSSYLTLFDASPRTALAPSAFPSFTSSLLRWDAFHFTAIAKDGYSYEHHWAFFPGVPLLLRVADRLPALFHADDAYSALSWLALFHVGIAIPTTRAIYHLTLIHFRSPSFALLTALLSLLPASPVTLYFAPYAEPIFTFLSYQGMCSIVYILLLVAVFLTFRSGIASCFRNARLCARALPPRFTVLLRCRSLPFEWRSACSLCPLVLVD